MTYIDELKEKFDGAIREGMATFSCTLYGPRAAAVEGAKRIIYYDDKTVKFAVGRRMLEIEGKDLRIASCNGNEYYLVGEIENVKVSQ